jgi:hypothetical protein
MALRLNMVVGSVYPDHHQFLVLASSAAGEAADGTDTKGTGSAPFVPAFTSGRVLYANGGTMYIVSEADRVDVQLETWDARPPADPEADVSEQAEVALPTGAAQGFALLGPAATPLLRVGPAGRYTVRVDVYRTGGTDDPTDTEAWDDEEGPETVVVRFWPAGDR